MGGEEFALFLPGAPRAAVDALGQRLTAALTVRDIESGDAARFTVSVGATPVAKGDGLADAISRADAALYRAKEAGRARMIFDSGLRAA
jgi:diguanylate cyclase (GGDEF)-like protein